MIIVAKSVEAEHMYHRIVMRVHSMKFVAEEQFHRKTEQFWSDDFLKMTGMSRRNLCSEISDAAHMICYADRFMEVVYCDISL